MNTNATKSATTRREISRRKEAMLRELRLAYQSAGSLPGDVAVSQRELSVRHGLSQRTVALEMQKLVEEGVLYMVPRVGTFVGRPHRAEPDCYLFVLPTVPASLGYSEYVNAARRGFEERVADLSGATIAMTCEGLRQYIAGEGLPRLSGVFQWGGIDRAALFGEAGCTAGALAALTRPGTLFGPDVPQVRFGHPAAMTLQAESPATDGAEPAPHVIPMDGVNFDSVAGGEQATHHLLSQGHRSVAFIGLHGPDTIPDDGSMHWSREREAGWRKAMDGAGLPWQGLSFLPAQSSALPNDAQLKSAKEAAEMLVRRPGITAVVAVNEIASSVVLEELRALNVPRSSWPAIICFDDSTESEANIVSSLHLPWSELGRSAADVLCERRHGRLTGGQHERVVAMRLVRRLTCRQDWTQLGVTGTTQVAEAARANGRGAMTAAARV